MYWLFFMYKSFDIFLMFKESEALFFVILRWWRWYLGGRVVWVAFFLHYQLPDDHKWFIHSLFLCRIFAPLQASPLCLTGYLSLVLLQHLCVWGHWRSDSFGVWIGESTHIPTIKPGQSIWVKFLIESTCAIIKSILENTIWTRFILLWNEYGPVPSQ